MIRGISEDILRRVYDFSDMTNEELRCKFFQKLQECIELCNNSSDILEWLKNEGLEKEVNELLTMWEQDGTLAKLINVELFNGLKTELLAKITKINEQLDNIKNNDVYIIDNNKSVDEIQTILNKQGKFKFARGIFEIDKTLNVTSNTIIEFNQDTVIKSMGCDRLLDIQGENIKINGGCFDGNNIANCGINVKTQSKNVNIDSNIITNIYGKNAPAYGIFVSGRRSESITINNNTIDTVISLGNATVGQRDGGWSKGIIVDIYGLSDQTLIESSADITNKVKITNNKINNIVDNEDGDGIYHDGWRPFANVDVEIAYNTITNCGKRGIKLLPSKGVRVHDNYILNDNPNRVMNGFISAYTNSVEIYNNKLMTLINCQTSTGIEFGFDSTLYTDVESNISIYNNFIDLGSIETSSNGIAKNNTVNNFDMIKIKDNKIYNAKCGIKLFNDSDSTTNIKNLIIENNYMNKVVEAMVHVGNKFDNCYINNNYCQNGMATRAINIVGQTTRKNKNLVISGNNILECSNAPVRVEYTEKVYFNNNYGLNLSIYTVSVDSVNQYNNYNTTTNTNISPQTINNLFKSVSSVPSSVTLDVSDLYINSLVRYNLSSSGTYTFDGITGGVDGQTVTLTTNLVSATFTLLKSSPFLRLQADYDLNNGKSITLVKVGTRWHEVSRSN